MKPTKFNQVQYAARKVAADSVKAKPTPDASVAALRERITALQKMISA